MIASASAPSTSTTDWDAINWQQTVVQVRRLQMRIAKAFQEGKHGKVKSLQWILAHSFHAKLLAVKRVCQNQGAKTPGTDGVVWNTSMEKMQAARSLRRRGYQTKPLKRIHIPKKQKGKFRPLSQALHLLTLEPIAELMSNKSAYGFRPLRSAADAIEKCFKALSLKHSAEYVLEGDIRACFDSISHKWLIGNIPIDTEILRKWLSAGYLEEGKFYPTTVGTPQGGIISPTILNITLAGLEATVKAACRPSDKVNFSIYADDFIITGATKEVLENKVKPIVDVFLNERGLCLSQDKTKITHIRDGIDFLGMNIRKYDHGKLIITPAKSSVKRFLADVRGTIKSNATAKTVDLISLLNPKIRGWTNYYHHVCSSKTFNRVSHEVFKALWRWAVRRHPKKNFEWIKRRYFHQYGHRNWIFSTRAKKKDGTHFNLSLIEASTVRIKRHIIIRSNATPYDSMHHQYLSERLSTRAGDKRKQVHNWWLCWWELL